MTQEEILQYNKRCAEFLGYKPTKCNNGLAWDIGKSILSNRHKFPIQGRLITTNCDYLLFHSDWNWIMDVVEAIEEKIGIKTIDECSEDEWYATISVTRLTITSKKEAVIRAINQFLIWYEQNKTV